MGPRKTRQHCNSTHTVCYRWRQFRSCGLFSSSAEYRDFRSITGRIKGILRKLCMKCMYKAW